MTVELSEQDIEIIQGWYESASGESASGLEIMPREHWSEEYLPKFEEARIEAGKIIVLMRKLGLTMTDQSKYFMEKADVS